MSEQMTNIERDVYVEFNEVITRNAEYSSKLARDGALLGQIAFTKLARNPDVDTVLASGQSIEATFEAIVANPKDKEPLSPRGELIASMNKEVKKHIKWREIDIYVAATVLGMRRGPESIGENYEAINAEAAIFVIEGGANKTSVIRRGVAEKAMHVVHGEDLGDKMLFQLGDAKRIVKPIRADGTANPEHKTIRELASEFLPNSHEFTEFDANLATALADGYELATLPEKIQATVAGTEEVERLLVLAHSDPSHPQLVLVGPNGKGLTGGLAAIGALQDVKDGQFVIATNGQYRPKDVLQAARYARKAGISMVPAVAIGDESGDTFKYRDEDVVVPARAAEAYVNEMAIYGRMAIEWTTQAQEA